MSDIQTTLEGEGYLGVRQMKNGEWVGVVYQIYTCGLCVGLDEFGYNRRYCYEKLSHALVAAALYDGEGDPDGPWIKVKGDGEERHGPGFKRIIDEHGSIDTQTLILTLSAVAFLFLSFMAGYDIGRRNLIMDIRHFGWEKVIEVYEGKK